MGARNSHGELVGTFDGATGDQFGEMRGMVDVSVREGDPPSDPAVDASGVIDADERPIELTLRAEKPVDEVRVRVELPEHGTRRLVEAIERALER